MKSLPIIWSEEAKSDLTTLQQFYENISESLAEKVITEIFSGAEKIIHFPKKHQVELTLKNDYRYLIVRHCKLIYKVGESNIKILGVFDTRQDPAKLKIK